jgi:hypothetical protein
MAYYAFLDENNIVTEVISGIDETELIEDLDPETWYGNFRGQVCKRTSINTAGGTHSSNGIPFRGNFAGIGFKYDENFDVFIAPKPFESWKLDYTTFSWVPPVSMPDANAGHKWRWSEINKEWIELEEKVGTE